MLVYILNRHGKPLMPCKPARARKLLKNKKAKVIKKEPFTIKLLYGSSGYKQPISLGVDAGSKMIGLSATTEKKELYSANVELRKDIVNKIATRRENRKSRRSRKTRHRKPRFKNRKKDKGWLAPSIRHKIETHEKAIAYVYEILPVTNLVVEIEEFDIQKIKNPDISGVEYQQGEQFGFWNVREYVLCRDNHTCQHCKGKTGDPVLVVHHIESRKTGGNAPNNLVTLCKTCHEDYHKNKIDLNIKRRESFRDASHMNIMRWNLYDGLKESYSNVSLTRGYITKAIRSKYNLPKEHYIDARCISGNPTVEPLGYYYYKKKVRRHNRQTHKVKPKKGVRKRHQAPSKVKGFELFDKVMFEGQVCFIFARRQRGYFTLRKLDGTTVNSGASYKKLKLIEHRKGYLTERRKAIHPQSKDMDNSCQD